MVNSPTNKIPSGRGIMKPMIQTLMALTLYFALLGQASLAIAQSQSDKLGQSIDYYTCSMHPQVRLSDPDAQCPICGMNLRQ